MRGWQIVAGGKNSSRRWRNDISGAPERRLLRNIPSKFLFMSLGLLRVVYICTGLANLVAARGFNPLEWAPDKIKWYFRWFRSRPTEFAFPSRNGEHGKQLSALFNFCCCICWLVRWDAVTRLLISTQQIANIIREKEKTPRSHLLEQERSFANVCVIQLGKKIVSWGKLADIEPIFD